MATKSHDIPRRPAAGPALLRAGFRPFFLGGAAWAAVAVGIWLAILEGAIPAPEGLDPVAWHSHELLFGYAAATVAGFLLTAIPNWTGRLPLQGRALAALAGVWLAGRIAMLATGTIGPAGAAAVDLAFLALLLAAVAREIAAGRNWRNAPMVGALALLLAANALMHAGQAALGQRLGIAVLACLIALVGGRIVPSFTRNWLVKRGEADLPAAFDALDRAALAVTAAGLAVWIAELRGPWAGALLVLAGGATAFRLGRWRGERTFAEPLVTVLHLGHVWLAAGLMLLGASEFADAIPPTAGIHALAAGAVGTMTLAVMSRATLGHTGRALTAGKGTVAIYALVQLAAIARVAAALAAAWQKPLWLAAGAAWIGAFALFVAIYGPMLVAPHAAAAEVR
jgi:uncharacterized protein involved in response to NO